MFGVAQWPFHRAPSVGTQLAIGMAAVSMSILAQSQSSTRRSTPTQLMGGAAVSKSLLALSPLRLPRSMGTQLVFLRIVAQRAVVLQSGEAQLLFRLLRSMEMQLPMMVAVSLSGVASQWPSPRAPSVLSLIHI